MVEIIAIVAVVLAVAIAIVLILAVAKPDSFSVQRSVSVQAKPEKIFPWINDFHQWKSWSPYENKDPAMKRSYSGAADGKGAVYGWEGNKNVGSGRMERFWMPRCRRRSSSSSISSRHSRATDTARIHHAAAGRCHQRDNQRHLADARSGALHCPGVMQVFINLDHMIGKDFEVGLVNLKNLAEK